MLEKSRLKDVAEVFGNVAAALDGLLEGDDAADGAAAAVADGLDEGPLALVPDPQAASPRAVVASTEVNANFLMSCKGLLLTIDCRRSRVGAAWRDRLVGEVASFTVGRGA